MTAETGLMPNSKNLSPLEPLPQPDTADGTTRRVGVEIELGDLGTAEVARVLTDTCGGKIREAGARDITVEGTEFGDIEVYLDTRFRHDMESRLGDTALDVAQLVVPVEIVGPPMDPALLPRLDAALTALARAGATGTSGGVLAGFGVHLNIEIADESAAQIGSVLTSFALLEQALRAAMQVDTMRRLLPFIAPYSPALTDRLVAERGSSVEGLAALYLDENPTRNSALDMLPVFAQLCPDVVARRIDDELVTARPTYHYRLPDCRLDEPGWSLTGEWNRWVVIERAASGPVLDALCEAWVTHRDRWVDTNRDWARQSAAILATHDMEFPQ